MPSGKKRPVKHAPIVNRFAARLREVRVSRGMTQFELARHADVTSSYITRLETARTAPGIDLIDRLAGALGCSAADLLPGEAAADGSEVLRGQIRRLSDDVLRDGDAETLQLTAMLLARIVASNRKS